MTSLITDRYASKIQGVLSCFDRVVIQGNLPHICYADGMARWLRTNEVRLYDYPRFVEPFNEKLRENAARLAKDSGCEIEYVTASLSKEKRIAQILAERGTAPGLVHVFSSMELCRTYRARYDDAKKMAFLKPDKGKCLHYYINFIDASQGLCYVREPTWGPCGSQFYYNGHNWLARKLDRAKVTYRMLDNAFVELGDVEKAQKLSDAFDTRQLHSTLDRYAALCCPAAGEFDEKYHWTLSQVEYSTDVIFRRQSDLKPLYQRSRALLFMRRKRAMLRRSWEGSLLAITRMKRETISRPVSRARGSSTVWALYRSRCMTRRQLFSVSRRPPTMCDSFLTTDVWNSAVARVCSNWRR